jgi:hypothetical protein
MTVRIGVKYRAVSDSGQWMNHCATLTLSKGVSTVGPVGKSTVTCRARWKSTFKNTDLVFTRSLAL